jgi:3-oxoadipate enol-lactonase
MKKTFLIFCILILSTGILFSQKSDENSSTAPSSGYIKVDGGKIFYETAGKGENMVLIHDGMIHHEIWDNQFQVFAKNYRVVRYDRRGYGKSPAAEAQFSNIDDLNQLFIQLKIDKAFLFGMSAGGGLAIDFALKYPEKINALVLVGAVVSGYGYSSHMATRGGHLKNPSEVLSDPKKTIKYFGWEDPYEIYAENIKAKERCLKLLEANPQNVDFKSNKYNKGPDRPAVKFLSEIKAPTLVLVGEYDIPDVHAHSGVIESGIPNAKREIISKAGHLIPLEQPEAFNASVLKFIGGVEFNNILKSKSTQSAVQYYNKKREVDPNIVLFDEKTMNNLGYNYLQNGKITDAIELFKLNTIAYPKSFNTYDSLGEAYMNYGNVKLAIENYEKSLALNPQNTNAVEQLKKLREK